MANIIVAGGSLGGLMAANLLHRAGHEVTVLERIVGAMEGRGAGIVTHPALVNGLRRCGMPADYELGVPIPGRVTLDREGQVLADMPLPQVLTSWSRLYHLLRELLPAQVAYRQGVAVEGLEQDAAGVRLRTSMGRVDVDLVVGADGIRSAVRQQLWPDVQPQYVGYMAWRGMCDEAVLSRATHDAVFERFGFCLPPGEQLVGYPIAGLANTTQPGRRAWNFVWYRPASTERLAQLLTDADGVHYPQGIPPQKVSWREIAQMRSDARRLLAPAFAEIIEKCAQPFLQPIFDVKSSELAKGRVALIGDAAFVARPHVGAGVLKAIVDALALEQALGRHGATPEALQAYSAERTPAGQAIVEHAQRLGAYMQAQDQSREAVRSRARSLMAQVAIDPDSKAAGAAAQAVPA